MLPYGADSDSDGGSPRDLLLSTVHEHTEVHKVLSGCSATRPPAPGALCVPPSVLTST